MGTGQRANGPTGKLVGPAASVVKFHKDRQGTARRIAADIRLTRRFTVCACLLFLFAGCRPFHPTSASEFAADHPRTDSLKTEVSNSGHPVVGVYGVSSLQGDRMESEVRKLRQAEANTVFISPDKDTIRRFRQGGFSVCLSVDVFGGTEAWSRWPDSRPVTDRGEPLGEVGAVHGGICPTHPQWRHSRLAYIESLARELADRGVEEKKGKATSEGTATGSNGIWLDFIRFPGRWETPSPEIPRTCYCQRCRRLFREWIWQQAKGAAGQTPAGGKRCESGSCCAFPGNFLTMPAPEAAKWLDEHCAYEWMVWKKEQILSFVREVRSRLDAVAVVGGEKIKLGVFVVPWRKGDFQDAVSYELGQDAFALSEVADVISPMVYHQMCGKRPDWVGEMVRYYEETSPAEVWPIIQAMDVSEAQFRCAVESAGRAGAEGLLVYKFEAMKPEFWPVLRDFEPSANLFEQALSSVEGGFVVRVEEDGGAGPKPATVMRAVRKGEAEGSGMAEVMRGGAALCVKARGGMHRSAEWTAALPACGSGGRYRFTCELFRPSWVNGAYPAVEIWGKEFLLNTHLARGRFQPVRVDVTCPGDEAERTFRFVNRFPGEVFCMRKPCLEEVQPDTVEPCSAAEPPAPEAAPAVFRDFFPDFFPVGMYGAGLANLREIAATGANTVVIGGSAEAVGRTAEECHKLGLRYVISVPREPDRLKPFLDDISGVVREGMVGFYVNDEPGIHAFPVNKAEDIQKLIHDRFPAAPTCMAVLRPQVCSFYRRAADFFLLDQYPVPSMPMIWLSDSMDEAALGVGRDRLGSVVQAFGGADTADWGWPRPPSREEMTCLAFLSIIHGSRAVFFFKFPSARDDPAARDSIACVVERLNRVRPWLPMPNEDKEAARVEMVSIYGVDPSGKPAVQCCLKKKGRLALLIAVNTIPTHVESRIQVRASTSMWKDLYTGETCSPVDGELRVRFRPYEVKLLVGREANP